MRTRLSELTVWHAVLLIVVWQACDTIGWALISYGDRVLKVVGF